jgi:tetratricopeptide (TPR) repeat protein
MICINCQHSLPENSKFCPQCGQKVSISDSTKSIKKEEISTAFSKPANAYILVISAVAAAILIVVLILQSNQQKIENQKNISANTQDLSEEVKAKLEKLAVDPESAQLNIEMGNMLFDAGEFVKAIPFYQKSLTKDSENIAVQIDMAVCYFNLRKIDQAIIEMDKALKIDPNHPKGLFNMGIIYYNIGKFDKVREYWQRLIAINPELTEAKRAQELLMNLEQN